MSKGVRGRRLRGRGMRGECAKRVGVQVRRRSRSVWWTSKGNGSTWTKRATLETTSCSPNAGSREVSLLWFQRGLQVTTQNPTSWVSLCMSPPRARQIPWRFASLPDPASCSRSSHPRPSWGVRWLREFLTSKSGGAQISRTFAPAVHCAARAPSWPRRSGTCGSCGGKGARRL